MGRGIAYGYDHFMLFEENCFFSYPYDAETDQEDTSAEPIWCDDSYADFKERIAEAFGTTVDDRKHWEWVSNEACVFTDTERLKIGIDSSGGSPCLFVIPKTYYLFGDHWKGEKDYVIDREVIKAFNKLIDMYSKNTLGQSNMFRYPSSAWTSYGLTGYRRDELKRKKKVSA
jgi:hypothetical protein